MCNQITHQVTVTKLPQLSFLASHICNALLFLSFPNVLDSSKVCMVWMLVKMGPIFHTPTIFLPDEYFQTYLSSIWFWIRNLEYWKCISCVSMSVFCIYIYLYFKFPKLMYKSGKFFLKTHIVRIFIVKSWNYTRYNKTIVKHRVDIFNSPHVPM